MKKLAVYDFCQTIVDFETGDGFIHFIMQKTGNKKMKLIDTARKLLRKMRIIKLIQHFYRGRCSLNKQLVLCQLRGLERRVINKYAEEYYQEIIKKHLINFVIKNIEQQKEKGYYIVIVSASYYPFLKLFCDDYNIDLLITNKFEYDRNGMFTGNIERDDCISKNKVRYLLEALELIDGKYEITESYGDSESDKYILNIATQGYVISKTNSKAWVKKTNFKEIVYE